MAFGSIQEVGGQMYSDGKLSETIPSDRSVRERETVRALMLSTLSKAVEGKSKRDFRSPTEGLDTTRPMGTALLTIVAAFTPGTRHDDRTHRTRPRRCCCQAVMEDGPRSRRRRRWQGQGTQRKGISAADIGKKRPGSRTRK